jgi:poly(3-hydroxybutyrate) depolymerase
LLYQLYEAQQAALYPLRVTAGLTAAAIECLPERWSGTRLARLQAAWCQMIVDTRITHTRPSFGIDKVLTGAGPTAVCEEPVLSTPFARLIRFSKGTTKEEPRVLIVAPLSGHFSTLMRETVRTMLADHDVYLAEWVNAREIPLDAGPFGLDDYIGHLVEFLEALGPGTHVMAVCQPGPAALAATAILAARDSPCQPRSLTLMASPIDTSVSPTAVNQLAMDRPLSWFSDHVVMPVPWGHPGCGRLVYPGFLQLAGFLSMNVERHLDRHSALYWNLVKGEWDDALAIREFYDEYFAVLDMDAGYYLDTVDRVFQRNLLAQGELIWRGQPVDPGAIRATALMTVEGERDDICGMGQTLAAHDLMTSVPPRNKRHHLQVGVGHYGVFSGSRWQQETYPKVQEFILASA